MKQNLTFATVEMPSITLAEKKTPYQHVQIVQTKQFGKIALLDRIVQFSEKDEGFYHESFVHPGMALHESPKNVLIIGGGDGGTLREALKHPIESATLVEIDGEAMELMRAHIPLAEEAFTDKRTTVIIGDGFAHLHETQNKYDVILLDLSDPEGPAEKLYQEGFYQTVKKALAPGGILISHTPTADYYAHQTQPIIRALSKTFATVTPYFEFVPSYFCSMTFAIASDTARTNTVAKTLTERKILLKTYTPEQLQNLLLPSAHLKDIKI